jgi:uncharacterized membrane protein
MPEPARGPALPPRRRRARSEKRLDGGNSHAALPRAILVATLLLILGDMAWTGRADSLDVAIYRCYAHAFWDGAKLLHATGTSMCGPLWPSPPERFHAFPHEYPPLALAVFTLPLLLPWLKYTAAFILWQALLLLAAIAVLVRRRCLQPAAALMIYVILAGWDFALQRFDLPAGLAVVGALLLARRGKMRSSAAVLALAVALKLFAVVLLPLLLIHARGKKDAAWRWDLVALFLAVCAATILPEVLLSPGSVLTPVRYELDRPLQIESLPGSMLWIASGMPGGTGAGGGVHTVFSYNSINVAGGPQLFCTVMATLLGLAGLAAAYLRAWKRRDQLDRGFVLILLAVLLSGKVFSPQYALWLLPLAAVTEGIRARWVALAGLVSLISYCYVSRSEALPHDGLFLSAIVARNALIVALTVWYALGRGDQEPAAQPHGAASP